MILHGILITRRDFATILDKIPENVYSIFFWIMLHRLGMILYLAQSLSFPGFSRNKFRISGFFKGFSGLK